MRRDYILSEKTNVCFGRSTKLKEIPKEKIIYCTPELSEDTLEKLKKAARETYTKDAINKAVYHYLDCHKTQETGLNPNKVSRSS